MKRNIAVSPATAADYALAVDTLAQLNAEIADREKRAKLLKAVLIGSGFKEIEGSAHKAVIVESEQERIDSKLARDVLTPETVASITKTVHITAVCVYDK